jgi:hypothetical protein
MMNLYKNGLITPGPYAYEVRYAKKHKDQILNVLSNLRKIMSNL